MDGKVVKKYQFDTMELMEKTSWRREKTQEDLEHEEHADRALAIYDSVKEEYEAKHYGKFLTIDLESKRVVMSETLDEAMDVVERQRERNYKSFFVLRIGYIHVGYM